MKHLLLCLVLTLFAGGCASMREMEGLETRVTNLQFLEATPFETTVLLTLRLENELPHPVQLSGGVHKFFLNGIPMGKGLSGESLQLPRFGSATQQIKVHLSNFAAIPQLRSIMQEQRVDYRLESLLYGEQKGRDRRMRVVKEAHLSASNFQTSGGVMKRQFVAE